MYKRFVKNNSAKAGEPLGIYHKTVMADNLNKELPDILADISEITYQASEVSEKINDTVGDITDIEKKISSEIKEPLLEAVGTLGGFLKALQVFVTYFMKKKKN